MRTGPHRGHQRFGIGIRRLFDARTGRGILGWLGGMVESIRYSFGVCHDHRTTLVVNCYHGVSRHGTVSEAVVNDVFEFNGDKEKRQDL